MRLLLDEMLDVSLRHSFVKHDVRTVPFMGWKGVSNGDLMNLARDDFDVIITSDKCMVTENTITKEDVGVIVLNAPSNDIEDHVPLVPEVLEELKTIGRGEIRRVPRQ